MNDTPQRGRPQPPFEAYVGNEPYIVAAYAPEDSALAYPEILRLHQAGYRVWYDAGITTGDAQTSEVETAISRCALFLVFVSTRLAASRNARHAVQVAVDGEKPFLAVTLEVTELKPALRLLMSGQQTICKYALSEAAYHDGLRKALPADTQVLSPFDAYLGDEPFVFVSYSHKDSALVFPEIKCLHEQGYCIWYDQGIPIGSDWRESIGDALAKCAVFLVFVTPRAVASVEVFAEVSMGFDRWKQNHPGDAYNFVAVYLEPTTLSHKWYFLPHLQTLRKYEMTPTTYRKTLDGALDKVRGVRNVPPISKPTLDVREAGILELPILLDETQASDAAAPSLPAAPARVSVSPPAAKQWIKPRRKLSNAPVRSVLAIAAKNIAKDNAPAPTVPITPQVHPPTKRNPQDGAEMILIPAGEFPMGDEDISDNPRRMVTLDGFYIYKNLVTVAQYRRFCNATSRQMPPEPSWGWKDDHPIVRVTWEDAEAYCTWAGIGLPTEAQWEKAARGTDGRKYPWGGEWNASRLQCSRKEYGDAKSTALVGSFPKGASFYGALDMAGNVWEWCADWYDDKYPKSAPDRNPTGPATGTVRVMRGGSWYNYDPDIFRAAFRNRFVPTLRNLNVGFRCASGV